MLSTTIIFYHVQFYHKFSVGIIRKNIYWVYALKKDKIDFYLKYYFMLEF